MSKIKDLLKDDNSVLVFDIDGVLAVMEFGEYNHFYGKSDDEWLQASDHGMNLYTEDKVSNKIKTFIEFKDKTRVYVVTKIRTDSEGKYKKAFAHKYYHIPLENIYIIDRNLEKTEALIEIKKKYPELDDKYLIMIDDTVKNLNEIMENTNFSTAHISTLLDM